MLKQHAKGFCDCQRKKKIVVRCFVHLSIIRLVLYQQITTASHLCTTKGTPELSHISEIDW